MVIYSFTFFDIPIEIRLGVVLFLTWLFFKVRRNIKGEGVARWLSFWSLVGLLLLLFTQILHEAVHVYIASWYGVSVTGAGVNFRQVYALLDFDLNSLTPVQFIIIHAASPLVNLVFGLFLTFWVWVFGESLPENTLQYVAKTNIFLFLFHLLPLPITDGGKVLTGVFWQLTGNPQQAEGLIWLIGLFVALLFLILRRKIDRILTDL